MLRTTLVVGAVSARGVESRPETSIDNRTEPVHIGAAMPTHEPVTLSDRFSIFLPSGHLRAADQIGAASGGLSRASVLRLLVSEALATRDSGAPRPGNRAGGRDDAVFVCVDGEGPQRRGGPGSEVGARQERLRQGTGGRSAGQARQPCRPAREIDAGWLTDAPGRCIMVLRTETDTMKTSGWFCGVLGYLGNDRVPRSVASALLV